MIIYFNNKIRSQICSFSGFKIYPGHGSVFSRSDGKLLNFLNHKCMKYYKNKIKAIKVAWTLLYKKINRNRK
jgi:large subunit ribosomal protein L24e